ncbi:hypothetical protein [Burkholderia gladioli]|uniref:hypothetical protein n=1 Tax=Burkholderia gladioli TaxID=28095 RepID=UPI00163FF3B4|nr:hypothetical protein [Burkholderia gladioli]
MSDVAVLFAKKNSIYHQIEGCDVWDAERDARNWRGGSVVVAHPPCSRWCRLAGLVEARWGHKRGDDGGLFAFALDQVRTWGGVLEHPAYSDAWLAFDLPPPAKIGWQRGICGGWSAHVEQGRYGHVAKKSTWLYAFGIEEPPTLRWGVNPDGQSSALVSWCGNHTKSFDQRPRVGKDAASATPIEFAHLLVELARQSRVSELI